ncbi:MULTISPECIES: response regulator transcription factor [Thalassospira]|jgi:DNA-binding response OmpR family regulator|uniref:XRE family transcriptional regulator n=1 Tax=Thalassospira xiamenensis TaxID=220697 RepID=A0ABR5Y2T6_9PROT|nr:MULTISPECIES: response regulator transcription factor [Thalassospira]MBL4841614.1 response regulator transcription factor [Thalassospira sp.]MBR9780451.1 response regulator transcription factor [Rhodospirillales bacterium]KZD04740.1 XRE family transcriptional regulator [Thalassospira xiamenensis]KZD05514.1 XRE family transcriptional regulator [Thalassospira xiamenensis]MBR9816881.1 response regulator transcription factor [Rhodospirillales bacterium]|tara:strand:- start:4680 stop:5360 length:681 start_codon:yes stop_codon:yes gene_type:complete
MKSTANIMVLLVEDNMDIAGTISDYLTIEGIECDHAFDGETGFQRALTGEYDVILLDIMLPFRDGISICNALRNEGIDTPVLMLTARDTLADKLEGFGAGADDYLVKPFALEELLMRTRVLSRRRSGEIRRFSLGDLIVDFENRHVARSGQAISLSPTSWTILEVLAQNSPHVVTRSRLSMALWQGDPPDTNALKTHLYKLRMRIDKPFNQNLIHTIAGQGVALRE